MVPYPARKVAAPGGHRVDDHDWPADRSRLNRRVRLPVLGTEAVDEIDHETDICRAARLHHLVRGEARCGHRFFQQHVPAVAGRHQGRGRQRGMGETDDDGIEVDRVEHRLVVGPRAHS